MKYYVYNYVDRTKVSDKEFAEKNMFSNNIGNIFFLQGVCNSLNAQIIGETSGGGGRIYKPISYPSQTCSGTVHKMKLII